MAERRIGNIGNYYGSLSVKEVDGFCFWSIENYDGDEWEEIPRSLFDELNRYEDANLNRSTSDLEETG